MEKQFDIGMTTREMLDIASGIMFAVDYTADLNKKMLDDGFNPMHMTGEEMILGFTETLERYRKIVNRLMGEAMKHRSGRDRTEIAALKLSRNSLIDYYINWYMGRVQSTHSAEGRGNS